MRKASRCASCPHPHHPYSICTGRSGGTAWKCGCVCPDARRPDMNGGIGWPPDGRTPVQVAADGKGAG